MLFLCTRSRQEKKCIIDFFDYSGHSITKYTLDTISNPFDVDEENRIIYNNNSEFFEDSFLKFTFFSFLWFKTIKQFVMKRLLVTISFIITAILFFSCTYIKKEDEITRLISEWSRREILFPKEIYFTVYGKDTVKYPTRRSRYSIVSYVDSVGCTSCKLQPHMWKKYISMLSPANGEEIPVLFFLCPTNRDELINLLVSNYFDHPVCIDENDTFNKLNKFPDKIDFQTFLLNEENRVVAMGNPIHNHKVRDLYIDIIQGKQMTYENEKIKTKVNVKNINLFLGTFDWNQEQKVEFILENTGDKLLVIDNVVTSCGCVTIGYSGEPIRPKGSVSLLVTYKAEQPEHFDKTIQVYCNAESSPILLKLTGEAK